MGDFIQSARASEVLFVDPWVPDLATILNNLRPGVDAIVLDGDTPAARQIAIALQGRQSLDAVHVIAHGRPGRVVFGADDWSVETLEDSAEQLTAIGDALRAHGKIGLLSCRTGIGAEGSEFVERLARSTGATVTAATGPVGAAELGGKWELRLHPDGAGVQPPLTDAGIERYSGLLGGKINIVASASPLDGTAALASGQYYIGTNVEGTKKYIGQFSFIPGLALNILVEISGARSDYSIYAGPTGDVSEGQVAVYDSAGKYSQAATRILLGPHGTPISITIRNRPTGASGRSEDRRFIFGKRA
jgi:hypothetical protein